MNTFSTTLRRIFRSSSGMKAADVSDPSIHDLPDPMESTSSMEATEPDDGLVPRSTAWRILISLMFPSMLMPLASSMSSVALPVIRDQFQLQADVTAWVPTAFTLPFMILMPVYGRLSDAVGRRRLILAGTMVCALGTVIVFVAPDVPWIMAGRAIQGVGLAGMMPLGLAMISAVFPAAERGRALGTWSSVGPIAGFISPLLAGFLIDGWGWRTAFLPPILMCIVAYAVVWRNIPSGLSNVRPDFWQTFDWGGTGLLASTLTCLLFYLSSGPITGYPPLQDWRLLAGVLLLLGTFLWWERHHPNPFMPLNLFSNLAFTQGTLGAATRMVSMMALFFTLPLYLVDVRGMTASGVGGMAMIMPGAMALMVRWAGGIADKFGSRRPIMIGFSIQLIVLILFSRLNAESPLWTLVALLAIHGAAVGLVLAPLHTMTLRTISDEMMGTAAGFYSMVRFVGTAIGVALAGVLLQNGLDQGLTQIEAYQRVFLSFTVFSVLGILLMMWKVGK
ncbi:MAG: MFS transporter [Chloroflexota bacterium]